MPLVWRKLVDCPEVPDCECPEPAGEPDWEGQIVTTDCGGSSSSSSESASSSDSDSSSETEPPAECAGGWCIYSTTYGDGGWSWISLAGNGAGWRKAPCYEGGPVTCPCLAPTMSAADAVAAYGSGRFYTVDCQTREILYYS